MITHHPDPELLFDYATGTLPEGPALVVATHVARCPECREAANRLDALGGSMLDDLGADTAGRAEVGEDVLAAVLARLDQPAPATERPGTRLSAESRRLYPSPLWPYLDEDPGRMKWKFMGPSVRCATLAGVAAPFRADLLRIKAGKKVPMHTHGGQELTLVLAGGFTDATGHYAAGDFAIADPELTHRPIADDDQDCICLAVVEAPLRPTGLIARLVAPLIKY